MNRLYYCVECKRVIESDKICGYCKGEELKEVIVKTPVSVIGTKIKGRIFKIKDGKVDILIRDEANNKIVKQYNTEQLKKVL